MTPVIAACPPRPETGTGSGGATLLDHDVVVVVLHKQSLYLHAFKARSGPGVR